MGCGELRFLYQNNGFAWVGFGVGTDDFHLKTRGLAHDRPSDYESTDMCFRRLETFHSSFREIEVILEHRPHKSQIQAFLSTVAQADTKKCFGVFLQFS